MSTLRLYGLTELAEQMQWDRRKAAVYLQRGRLPAPAVRLACGPIWTGEQVDALLRVRGAVDADNTPRPAAEPIAAGRDFLHRTVRAPDGRPRPCRVLSVRRGFVTFALLRLDLPKPVRRSQRVDAETFTGEHLGRWVEDPRKTLVTAPPPPNAADIRPDRIFEHREWRTSTGAPVSCVVKGIGDRISFALVSDGMVTGKTRTATPAVFRAKHWGGPWAADARRTDTREVMALDNVLGSRRPTQEARSGVQTVAGVSEPTGNPKRLS